MLGLLNLYPPYLGAGVRVRRERDAEGNTVAFEARMKLRWWNRNYVGTHFGGSLYSMCDPYFMLLMMEHLGRGFIVWDKAATIRFLRPGKGTVRARFAIAEDEVARVRALAERERKVEPTYSADVVDDDGEVVAVIEKLLYVRRKTEA